MAVSVFPERMDQINPEDVEASLRTLETYIHYICERTEFALTNTFRTTSGLGSSAQEVALALQETVDNLSAVSSQLADAQTNITRLQDDVGGLADNLSSFEPLLTGQSDGPAERVVFTAPGEDLPLKACAAEITPVQEGEGDPSPENVRSIAGWTGLHLYLSPTEDAADGKTYAVDWSAEAGTVYGGTLDVLTGTLTADRVCKTLAGTDIQARGGSTTAAGDYRFYCTAATSEGILLPPNAQTAADVLCSVAVAIPHGNSSLHGVSVNRADGRIYLHIQECGQMTRDQFRTWVDSNTVQVMYRLAVPVTYRIGPQMVTTLAGANNIWADTGDVTVEHGAYLAALQAEIEKLQEGGD